MCLAAKAVYTHAFNESCEDSRIAADDLKRNSVRSDERASGDPAVTERASIGNEQSPRVYQTKRPSARGPRAAGSINEVGWRFQPFGINDLEMVAQIFPRWNPLTSWMRQIEVFQRAA